MAQVSIPNRPAGSDVRSIAAILDDFDAILTAINGDLEYDNLATAGVREENLATGANGPCKGLVIASGTHAAVPLDTWTRIPLVESVDLSSWFASEKYTPQVAGYYHVDFGVEPNDSLSGEYIAAIHKNNVRQTLLEVGGKLGVDLTGAEQRCGGGIIQMNGTTDFLDLRVYHGGTGTPLPVEGRLFITLIGRS